MNRMIDYYQALERLQHELTPVADQETVPLLACPGRILARPLAAKYDTPAFDNSAMDGYAVCDPQQTLTRFTLCGRTAAGEVAAAALLPGQAVRLFTGAPLPAGATAVEAQENTRLEEGELLLDKVAPVGQHIRRRAEEIVAGADLLAAGVRLGPATLALAASQGYAQLPVVRRLVVAVFSSGNELCEPGAVLAEAKIHDANRYQLLAWLAGFPVEVIDGGVLPDDAGKTRERLAAMADRVDVILTSGGASVGEEDHLKAALQSLGSLDAWKLAIKPGKPFAWGRAGAARVFMLPGNPVATFATFCLLVAPALRWLAGERAFMPQTWRARAAFSRQGTEKRREFLRARVEQSPQGELLVTPLPGQGSAMLSSCAAANVLVEIPPQTAVEPGDWLKVYPLS
jgi:molybdopterin molybdotransferase